VQSTLFNVDQPRKEQGGGKREEEKGERETSENNSYLLQDYGLEKEQVHLHHLVCPDPRGRKKER